MEPDYTKRRKIACITSVAALIVLVLYTRCAEQDDILAEELPESIVLVDTENSEDEGSVDDLLATVSATDEQEEAATEVEYLLLLGTDRSRGGIGRTDAIMIVALDHDSGSIGVISVPRDLWVDIPGLEPGRINKVYRVGDHMLGPGHGLELLAAVIQRELEIELSYTAAVDFAGFQRIVDALGGIPVDVKCPIEDCFISPGKGPCRRLSLDAGRQKMNGTTALLFTRSRHGRTDLDRARRQQAVLLGLWERLVSFDTLVRLPALWHELRAHVSTDIDLAGVLRLAAFAAKVRADSLHGLVLKPPVVAARITSEGKHVLELDKAMFDVALSQLFTASLPGKRKRPVCRRRNAALNWRDHSG